MELVRSRPSNRMLAILGIVACAALWGASAPMIKQLIDTFPPCTLAALRLGIAVTVLLPVLVMTGQRPRFNREAIALGLSGVGAFQLLQNFGMERMPAGPAVVTVLGASVVLTALLGWVVLGERCSLSMVLAMVGCGIGVALVAMSGGAAISFPVIGMALLVASAFAWAVYAVIGRRSSDGEMLEVMTGALIVGLVAILPFVAWERPDTGAMSVGLSDVVMLALLGGLATVGPYFCWSYSIRHLQANEASVLCSIEPAFGLLFAWWLLQEGISLQEAIGAAVVVASCMLVAMGEGPVAAEPVVVEPEPQSASLMVAL
jgi:drug/metabolite transporter (DMT)-like permease